MKNEKYYYIVNMTTEERIDKDFNNYFDAKTLAIDLSTHNSCQYKVYEYNKHAPETPPRGVVFIWHGKIEWEIY